jgi:hypothetical protein
MRFSYLILVREEKVRSEARRGSSDVDEASDPRHIEQDQISRRG